MSSALTMIKGRFGLSATPMVSLLAPSGCTVLGTRRTATLCQQSARKAFPLALQLRSEAGVSLYCRDTGRQKTIWKRVSPAAVPVMLQRLKSCLMIGVGRLLITSRCLFNVECGDIVSEIYEIVEALEKKGLRII